MNLPGLSNAYLPSTTGLSGKTSAYTTPEIPPSTPLNLRGDKVIISDQGKALVNQVPEDLLRHALPSWFTDYVPKVSIVNNSDAHKVGYIAQAQEYRANYKNEMIEFNKIFNAAFESARAEHGIITQNDMYEKVTKNPVLSEVFRQTVDQKIHAYPRAEALMKILDIGSK